MLAPVVERTEADTHDVKKKRTLVLVVVKGWNTQILVRSDARVTPLPTLDVYYFRARDGYYYPCYY